jgi:hypothetical protein
MNIKFITNKKQELQTLLDEIDCQARVIGYGLTTFLPPEEIIAEYRDKKSQQGRDKVYNYLESNYSEKDYLNLQNKAQKKWQPVEEIFFANLQKVGNFDIKESYEAIITMFGPGGSYRLPNTITIRLATEKDFKDINQNIAHEIIHLALEEFLNKKNILNWQQREDEVNKVLQKVMPFDF